MTSHDADWLSETVAELANQVSRLLRDLNSAAVVCVSKASPANVRRLEQLGGELGRTAASHAVARARLEASRGGADAPISDDERAASRPGAAAGRGSVAGYRAAALAVGASR